jgi:hypothetical protein
MPRRLLRSMSASLLDPRVPTPGGSLQAGVSHPSQHRASDGAAGARVERCPTPIGTIEDQPGP